MTKTPYTVPINIPPIAEMPIERLPTEPAPVAKNSGVSPAMKANEVIRTGRNRAAAP